uniref:Putative nonfluorescent protein n=1 Tax=Lampea lactea TaxID=1403706 RepID=A0A1C8YXN3_9METZ|nr:putative nonfluorescent protein [Lampea lactea]
MESRMERSISLFTGTAKSKVIATVKIDDMEYTITGEGFACPTEGQQNLELHCSGTSALPINWCILGTIIQCNFKLFTQYKGSNEYDFFKTSFPGGLKVEYVGSFVDGAEVSGNSTMSYVKDTVICRCSIQCKGFSEESPARAHDLGQTLTCYEVVEGLRADEVTSQVSLEWLDGYNQKYACRLNSSVKSSGSQGNFSPSRHFIGHHFKVTDKSPNNLHFAQRLKSRACSINYYKN